ncbi:MAG: hypothetical protein EHM20_04435 [Alphaproteobacteria bacterium]|nr:MAG: hypothetical protein EHM20_04435 [Alphaproteobacteria bacterium]
MEPGSSYRIENKGVVGAKDKIDLEIIKYIKMLNGNPNLRLFRERHCTSSSNRQFSSVSQPYQHLFYISSCAKKGAKYCGFRQFYVSSSGFYEQCKVCKVRFPQATLIPVSKEIAVMLDEDSAVTKYSSKPPSEQNLTIKDELFTALNGNVFLSNIQLNELTTILENYDTYKNIYDIHFK